MIKVRIYSSGAAVGMELEGHAGSGEPGQDLVCAAASTLVFAVDELFSRMEADGRLELRQPPLVEKGRARLEVQPEGQSAAALEGAMELACCFFRLLQENYPENIEFYREYE